MRAKYWAAAVSLMLAPLARAEAAAQVEAVTLVEDGQDVAKPSCPAHTTAKIILGVVRAGAGFENGRTIGVTPIVVVFNDHWQAHLMLSSEGAPGEPSPRPPAVPSLMTATVVCDTD